MFKVENLGIEYSRIEEGGELRITKKEREGAGTYVGQVGRLCLVVSEVDFRAGLYVISSYQ